MEERLQKIISGAGIASRRAAEQMILAGRVSVDGRVVTELGTKWDAALHEIAVDGRPIGRQERRVYFLLNKPKGFLSTAKDDRSRKTVLDLLPEVKDRVYPVGRLDYQTEGLLLITNDGALMQGLLHPKYEVEKTYLAEVDGALSEDKLKMLREGIPLEDGMTAPAKVRTLPGKGRVPQVEITIHEGRNRQVRRMLAAVGCDVLRLERVRFAGLELGRLARGSHRELTESELAGLKKLAGMEDEEREQ